MDILRPVAVGSRTGFELPRAIKIGARVYFLPSSTALHFRPLARRSSPVPRARHSRVLYRLNGSALAAAAAYLRGIGRGRRVSGTFSPPAVDRTGRERGIRSVKSGVIFDVKTSYLFTRSIRLLAGGRKQICVDHDESMRTARKMRISVGRFIYGRDSGTADFRRGNGLCPTTTVRKYDYSYIVVNRYCA